MATLASYDDGDSDYGYDLTAEEEALVSAAIASLSPPHAPAGHATAATASTSSAAFSGTAAGAALDHNDFDFDVSELDTSTAYGYAPSRGASEISKPRSTRLPLALPDQTISYPDLTSMLLDVSSLRNFEPQEAPSLAAARDGRAPITRFRTFPRKPFSVSDFTAGAWCEMQYHYVLTRLRGRKVRTEAMKGGTKVHERLEDEIYTTVKVDVKKKEDGFGLKLWNIIQGLRTLRDAGLTRELEVWGLVHGNVVNGIIDGLSYKNPDPEFEEEVRSSQSSQNSQPAQPQITDFLARVSQPKPKPKPDKLVYITDVKTRASKSLPNGAQVRSTKIQLFLYHRFLSDMASGKLNYETVFRRYGLNPDESFSDVFMAQIGALHDEVFTDAPAALHAASSAPSSSPLSSPSQPQSSQNDPASSPPPPDLLKYRSLRALVGLLKSEIQLTFPCGAESIGSIVAVEYRARASVEDPAGGAVIGENLFAVDSNTLDGYLDQYMEWWTGEREARGVPINEAFKCRSCSFVDDCEWRMEQDREMVKKAKENQGKGRRKASEEMW